MNSERTQFDPEQSGMPPGTLRAWSTLMPPLLSHRLALPTPPPPGPWPLPTPPQERMAEPRVVPGGRRCRDTAGVFSSGRLDGAAEAPGASRASRTSGGLSTTALPLPGLSAPLPPVRL